MSLCARAISNARSWNGAASSGTLWARRCWSGSAGGCAKQPQPISSEARLPQPQSGFRPSWRRSNHGHAWPPCSLFVTVALLFEQTLLVRRRGWFCHGLDLGFFILLASKTSHYWPRRSCPRIRPSHFAQGPLRASSCNPSYPAAEAPRLFWRAFALCSRRPFSPSCRRGSRCCHPRSCPTSVPSS
jgi:hypothetical protein